MLSIYPLGVQSLSVLEALLVLVGVLGVRAVLKRSKNPLKLPYPPGPRPSAIPLVGNLADMPSAQGTVPSPRMCSRLINEQNGRPSMNGAWYTASASYLARNAITYLSAQGRW